MGESSLLPKRTVVFPGLKQAAVCPGTLSLPCAVQWGPGVVTGAHVSPFSKPLPSPLFSRLLPPPIKFQFCFNQLPQTSVSVSDP